ncbi:MAG: glycosyltransferase [Caldilineaceae bacterium]|nr:glycosyltransferase [Caldilineaceae bacterium]
MYPALAVLPHLAKAAQANGQPAHQPAAQNEVQPAPQAAVAAGPEILWAGSPGGVERSLVESEQIPFAPIQTGQLRGMNPLTALGNAGKMVVGVRQARSLIADFRPDVCFVTGGYVCTPVAIACRTAGVPVLVYLPDLTPGLAIRMLGTIAQQVAVSFPETATYFGNKGIVTGYPVRQALLDAVQDRHTARQQLGQALGVEWREDDSHLPLLLVFGGSQGAHSINQAIWSALPELLPLAQIVHIVGVRDWPLLAQHQPALPEALSRRYHPVDYLHDEMALALASADLAVARAGASTLAEFPIARLPSVLVPLPISGGHQFPNAHKLADAGGALIVRDEELAEKLLPALKSLLTDESRRLQMGADVAKLSCPQAGLNIARALLALGGGKKQL